MPLWPTTFLCRFLAMVVLFLAAPILLANPPGLASNPPGLERDFDLFGQFVAEEYAYFDSKNTQWDKVCASRRSSLAHTADTGTLLSAIESALGELYDPHAHVGSSNPNSPMLIPTHSEVWATWDGDAAVLEEVREGSGAAKAGLVPGMRVLAINGEPIATAARHRHPQFLSGPDPEAWSWALQSVLAGRQDHQPLRLSIQWQGLNSTIPYTPASAPATTALSCQRMKGTWGYIRFHNSLGDDQTIAAFDRALDSMLDTKGLILDLRDTPSGGNSTVARGIMGRLVKVGSPYQVHELVSEGRLTGIRRRWVEYVMPRGMCYSAPVVVLVGRWTGSMAEGLAIGLNATRSAPLLGTPMARMLGALGEIKLPFSGLVVRIPTEKLFHINGTPREACLPRPVLKNPLSKGGGDATLEAGLSVLANAVATASESTQQKP